MSEKQSVMPFGENKKIGKYEIKEGDTFDLIKTLEDDSIQLAITSPPYNIGKSYEKKQGLSGYLELYKDFAISLFQKLSPRGNLCWQVGNFVRKGEVFPLDIYFYEIFKKAGFQLRNRIIWHFGHGLHAKKRFSGRYETILWFSKSDDYVFNLDPVRVPSKYPGKRHFKGKKKGQISGNPLGKNPSDFWEIVAQDWENEIWEIPNVKSNHPEKTEHPCQFPIELVQRCVLALTNEGDSVLDPFMGVGSSLIAAIMHNRKGIGFEKENIYIDSCKKRIQAFKAGELKIRPLGKTVHKPSGKEKVAQIPIEWKQE